MLTEKLRLNGKLIILCKLISILHHLLSDMEKLELFLELRDIEYDKFLKFLFICESYLYISMDHLIYRCFYYNFKTLIYKKIKKHTLS